MLESGYYNIQKNYISSKIFKQDNQYNKLKNNPQVKPKRVMYALSQPSTFRGNQKLFGPAIIVQQDPGVCEDRYCTDPVCLAIFIILSLTFFGIFTYGMIQGTPSKVFTAYSSQVACYQTQFTYGFLPNNSTLSNAVCVKSCPDRGQTVQCLKNNISCLTGSITSTYDTFDLFIFCAPDPTITNGTSITQLIGISTFGQWSYDVSHGYPVLIAAFLATVTLSCIYICLIRCCTTIIIWASIVFILAALLCVGTFILLQAFGVQVSQFIPIYVPGSTTDLFILGGVILGIAFVFLIMVICLCHRLKRGISVVQTASIYIGQTCQVLILPILTATLMLAFLVLIFTGGIYLYSTGAILISPSEVFAIISIDSITIILLGIYGCAGLWLLFFIHGCNTFTLTSSASIWYWNHREDQKHNPVCHSISWLICYHIGTIAVSSFLFTIFFIIRIIVQIFDVIEEQEEQGRCLSCCLSCIKCCLCICNIFLRFLSQGMYVQVAVNGTGYCTSTLEAFDVLTDNGLKLTLTSGISFFISLIGVLFISAGVTTASYFVQIEIQTLAQGLTDPVPITILCGLISFATAIIFMSIIGVSASAIIQCYIIDQLRCKVKGMYARSCPEDLRLLLQANRLK